MQNGIIEKVCKKLRNFKHPSNIGLSVFLFKFKGASKDPLLTHIFFLIKWQVLKNKRLKPKLFKEKSIRSASLLQLREVKY